MLARDTETLAITRRHDADQTVVALGGRFTFAAHAAFQAVLVEEIESTAAGRSIRFDLAAVEFIDSAGLGMLLLARDAARQRSASIILGGATGQVQRMLAVSRFETLFAIEP